MIKHEIYLFYIYSNIFGLVNKVTVF